MQLANASPAQPKSNKGARVIRPGKGAKLEQAVTPKLFEKLAQLLPAGSGIDVISVDQVAL